MNTINIRQSISAVGNDTLCAAGLNEFAPELFDDQPACGPSTAEQVETHPKRQTVIFVPTDFSEASFAAAKVGVELAKRDGGHLIFFHAVHLNLTPYGPANPAWLKTALRTEASEKATPFLEYAQNSGVRTTCVVAEGAQSQAILKHAAQWQASVIVMTSRKRGWFAKLFLRPIVERVVRDATCPVMVLQRDEKKRANHTREFIEKYFQKDRTNLVPHSSNMQI